ncbi:hypothetical protein ABW16_01715 [Mycolicibacter heraklionensis]|uniref:Minor tail protein n=1 Tax=Mycolicibacter heraklionensis TaxID=512402 RepID=A0ABR5FKM3_9MYCO|nr:hypothetical protein [Mycolicibacter heraklionensis]KLO31580.1 hypothetical protein ABW16_01715 [Mycolicibacter heraklionensis]
MTAPEMSGVWDFSPVGYPAGAVMYRGDVLFPAGIEPGTTQTAVCVFGPGGALINIPPLAEGRPGPSPQFRKLDVIPVPYGQPLPDPAGQFIPVSPGGPGIPAVYDVVIYMNQGQPGDPGPGNDLTSAPDVNGTPTADGWTLAWNEATNMFDYVPQLITDIFTGQPISTPASSQASRTLTELALPARPYAWYPQPHGQCVVSGTQNTLITLTANLNSPTGPQVGVGWAIGGQAQIAINLTPQLPIPATPAKVAANETATIFFVATQSNPTNDTWSTAASQTAFTCNQIPALL